jgi:hypothetical protein
VHYSSVKLRGKKKSQNFEEIFYWRIGEPAFCLLAILKIVKLLCNLL